MNFNIVDVFKKKKKGINTQIHAVFLSGFLPFTSQWSAPDY